MKGGDELERAARREVERRERLERARRANIWFYLTWLGSLGWLVVVPALAGAFLGRSLDAVFGTRIAFAAALTLLGAAAGMYLLWRRMGRDEEP